MSVTDLTMTKQQEKRIHWNRQSLDQRQQNSRLWPIHQTGEIRGRGESIKRAGSVAWWWSKPRIIYHSQAAWVAALGWRATSFWIDMKWRQENAVGRRWPRSQVNVLLDRWYWHGLGWLVISASGAEFIRGEIRPPLTLMEADGRTWSDWPLM